MSLLIVVAVVVPFAGCSDRPTASVNSSAATQADGKMAEIDAGLLTGPVFVELGTQWCPDCQREKPIIARLAANYTKVSFVDVDLDVNGTFADDFFVWGIPQMHVIVRKNPDGSYLYVDPYGNTTMDRYRSRIVGNPEYDDLKMLLDAAIAAR